MRRRTILLLLSAVLVSTVVYANSLAALTVYSSEKPPQHVVAASVSPVPVKADAAQTDVVVAAQSVKKQAPVVIKGNSLSIASIGFQGSIVDVGVTAENAIDVPASHVGRWIGSAQPGAPGAVFLDGHVEGVFARLNKLTVGQIVTMQYNGQAFNYKVAFTEIVDLATIDMNRSLSVYSGATEGLNIMTCAGTYIPSAGTYDKRLVVYTVRVS